MVAHISPTSASRRFLYCSGEAFTQSGLRFIVINNLGKKFKACGGDKPRVLQRARRLASAKTSSAENVASSPRSNAATRLSISKSQAASISATGASRSDSSSTSASRARSSGDSERAWCSSSLSVVDMVVPSKSHDHFTLSHNSTRGTLALNRDLTAVCSRYGPSSRDQAGQGTRANCAFEGTRIVPRALQRGR